MIPQTPVKQNNNAGGAWYYFGAQIYEHIIFQRRPTSHISRCKYSLKEEHNLKRNAISPCHVVRVSSWCFLCRDFFADHITRAYFSTHMLFRQEYQVFWTNVNVYGK